MLRADLHIHSKYSVNKDCKMPLETIIARCQKTGINCIALTDHGTAEGALEMQKLAPFKVIVGEEILTPNGEIMGLFLKESIPSNISIAEAISRIRAQGGLVSLPHPFDPLRGLKNMDNNSMERLLGQVDLIEVFNARGPFIRPMAKAAATAKRLNLPGSAGSDAHYPFEIGYTYIEMPEFNHQEEFLQALRQGTICKRRARLLVYLRTTGERLLNLTLRRKARSSDSR